MGCAVFWLVTGLILTILMVIAWVDETPGASLLTIILYGGLPIIVGIVGIYLESIRQSDKKNNGNHEI